MEPKFIHISDIRLGMKLSNKQFSLKEREKRREELWDTFEDIIRTVKKENVKYLFIAGNMTEGEYLNFKNLKRLVQNFKIIYDTEVVITCGKSDAYNINSMYEYIEWPQNVHFIKKTDSVEKINFDDDDLYVYSVNNSNGDDSLQLLSDVETDEKRINVLLLNCDTDSDEMQELDIEKLSDKFDYCALGGKHNYKKVMPNIVYSGTPEPVSFDEIQEHGIVKGKLSKGNVEYEFVPMAKRKFVVRDIDINLSYSFNKILDLIKFSGDTISNIKNYVKVNLNGIVNADISIEEIKNEAKQFFYYIEFEENFIYKNSEEKRYEDNEYNIIESYKLQFGNHRSRIEQQAFELGLSVLRKEKVVR